MLTVSLSDPDKLKQSGFMDHEVDILTYPASQKLRRQNSLKEQKALQIIE